MYHIYIYIYILILIISITLFSIYLLYIIYYAIYGRARPSGSAAELRASTTNCYYYLLITNC